MMNKTHAERLARWKEKNSKENIPYITHESIKELSKKIDAIFYGHKKIIRDKFI